MTKRFSILYCFCLLFASISEIKATHLVGSEITLACQSACTVRVFVRVYRDCSGATSASNTINWSSAMPGCFLTPPAISPWSPQVTTEVTPVCPSAITTCTNPASLIMGVQEYMWWRDYEICSVAPCVYNVSWTTCCRNASISSLNSPGSQSIYNGGTSYNTGLPTCNSSPVYSNVPLFYACQGLPYTVDQGAYDPDGDSLVFSLGSCYNAQGVPSSYATGYSPTAPLGPSWAVTINSATGILTLTPQPGNLVVGVLCVYINEYRGGSLIGTYQRDIQIAIIGCGANNNPAFAGISNTSGNASVNGSVVTVCGLSQVCFDVTTGDPDPGQNLTLSWTQNIPGATFTEVGNPAVQNSIPGTSASPPSGRFCWTPAAPGTYFLRLRLRDNFCPVYGQAEMVVTIQVGGTAPSGASASSNGCLTGSFTASACGGTGSYTYVWSGAGGLSGTTASISHTYSAPGSYPWQVIISDGAGIQDTIIDTLVISQVLNYQAMISGGTGLNPCSGVGSNLLAATGGMSSYLWSTGATTSSITVTSPGTYGLTVQDANGCLFNDSAVVGMTAADISGRVVTSTNAPLQGQKVYLIRYNILQLTLTAIDSFITDMAGNYFFCNVTDTVVFVKAAPDSSAYPNEMPTYADSSLYWNQAQPYFPVFQAPLTVNFATIFGQNPGGPGFIGGLVTQGANKRENVGDPIPGLTLFLKNAISGQILGYTITDVNGYFSFPNIPLANYEIVPDKPNVDENNPPSLLLSTQIPFRDSLDFRLHSTYLELVMPTEVTPTLQGSFRFSAAPNPFSSLTKVWLRLAEQQVADLRVYNVLGVEVETLHSGMISSGLHEFEIGNGLSEGIYFVRMKRDTGTSTLKVLKTGN